MAARLSLRIQRLQHWGIVVLIFLIAFLPRVVYPVSWPMQWYNRAVRFGDAVLSGDWSGTFQSGHPGVTTMWLSGIGLKLFAWQRELSSDQLLGVEATKPGVVDDAVSAGVVPLAVVISLCIALLYYVVAGIAGRKIAFVAGCLLALDPFYITYSKVLHVDALSATLMAVGVLSLLSYLHQGKRFALALSGVAAGLAFLSKSPSVFLIPYVALAGGMCRLPVAGWTEWRRWARWLWVIFRLMLVWCGLAAMAFVLLWPAMWVGPLDVLSRMAERIVFHAGTPHDNPVFFNGSVSFEDAGLLFYPATIAWKTTLVTLPAALAALVAALVGAGGSTIRRLTWLLLAFVFFFTLQMGFSAHKELPYLLPVFPVIDLMAAIGVVQIARLVCRARWWSKYRWVSPVLIGSLLSLQALVTLSHHPYYGTHHNRLLGGSEVAQRILPLQDQAEGLDLAAQYLNTLRGAQGARAAVHQRGAALFRRNFVGLTTSFDDPSVDFRVYFLNQIMRDLESEQWEDAWNADRRSEPLWTVAFDGVAYVWIYGSVPGERAAGGVGLQADYQLGEHIRLLGGRLSTTAPSPGDELIVVLLWESDGEVTESYTVFCHVTSSDGDLVAQQDGVPLHGVRPTSTWRAGEVMEDSYEIVLGRDLASGEYELSVGMYDEDTMGRLPVHDSLGGRPPEDRIPLGYLRVEAAPLSEGVSSP